MLNTITIMGRMTRDPELKTTPSGAAVTSFTLAVERDFKDKETGEKATDFIDCVAWRGTAEFVARYFSKGRMAVASGRLQLRDYTDKDGNKRRAAEVVAENVYFGDSNNGNRGAENGDNYQTGGWTEVPDGEGLPFDLPM
jgi:single-strand DNA-binding protein